MQKIEMSDIEYEFDREFREVVISTPRDGNGVGSMSYKEAEKFAKKILKEVKNRQKPRSD